MDMFSFRFPANFHFSIFLILLLLSYNIASAPLKRTASWSFDEKLLMQSLYKVMLDVIVLEIFSIRAFPCFLERDNLYHIPPRRFWFDNWSSTCRFYFLCQKPIPLSYIWGMLIGYYVDHKPYTTCSKKCWRNSLDRFWFLVREF